MPEELLDLADAGATGEEVRRVRVAQHVARSRDTGTPAVLAHEDAERHRREALTWAVGHVPHEHLAAFESVAETLVAALASDPLSALTTCRYCDEKRCTSCPMETFGPIVMKQ